MKAVKIGIVGANGLVGRNVLKALDEYKIPISNLSLYGSNRSAGHVVTFQGDEYTIEELDEASINKDLDIVFMCASGDVSKEYIQFFINNKTYVIDNSSVFRMAEDVPLVVPEVNLETIKKGQFLIANPNCTTIQVSVPLNVINNLFGLKRINYSTYQAVSGSGVAGVNDLKDNTKNFYLDKITENLIPIIDEYESDGYTREEHKMINETKKILEKPDLAISATCIRVPIEVGHAVSVSVETNEIVEIDKLISGFNDDLSIIVKNHPQDGFYPKASDALGNDLVYVGRIRKDLFNEKILHFYCVADNLRKGAAGNSVQIAKYLVDNIL